MGIVAFSLPGLAYFKDGGPWMYPLAFCSILALMVILYKAWDFWKASGNADAMLQAIQAHLDRGDRAGAAQLCAGDETACATVAGAALEAAQHGSAAAREAAQNAGTVKLASLETYLPVLSTVANISPLIGFLGTVTGMIKAFHAISEYGMGEPGVVAAGIAEALVTTATGLMIAIPCFAAYNYFVTRLSRMTLEMQHVGQHVINELAAGRVEESAAA